MTVPSESSSRILVKNLPKYITQERLKSLFSSHGTITDVKLIKTATGNSRRFCYIGFKTDQEGLDAVKYFNNTFIDTMKISVEIAFSIGNESIPRAWSKYSAGSSAFIKNAPETKEKDLTEKQQKFLKEIDVDEDFEEFMSVMRPRNAAPSRTWANDDVGKDLKVVPAVDKEDDDLYQELPSKFLDDEESESEEVTVPSQAAPSAAFDEGISDMEYFKMKMAKEPVQEKMKVNRGRMELLKEAGTIDEDLVENTIDATADTVRKDSKEPITNVSFADAQEETKVEVIDSTLVVTEKVITDPSPDLIADTGRIMVRNLPYSCTYEDLESHFKQFGPIAEVSP
jgi:multiple RNA-binding domain-containing protein 1